MGESVKRFRHTTLTGNRGFYHGVYGWLRSGKFTASGNVDRSRNSHYVHYNSTGLNMDLEAGEEEPSDSDFEFFEKFHTAVEEQMREWNKEIEKALYAEMEYRSKEETIAEELDGNDVMFTPEGKRVYVSEYKPFEHLSPEIQAKALARYSKIFAMGEDQVKLKLIASGERFGQNGYAVDMGDFKPLLQLPPAVKDKVLDKERMWTLEDNSWSEFTIDDWTGLLERHGFRDVEIAYSLGYSQGDGASFTAKSINVQQLAERLLQGDAESSEKAPE